MYRAVKKHQVPSVFWIPAGSRLLHRATTDTDISGHATYGPGPDDTDHVDESRKTIDLRNYANQHLCVPHSAASSSIKITSSLSSTLSFSYGRSYSE
jgi:hypothetical protein